MKYVSNICKLFFTLVIVAYVIATVIIFIGMTHYTQWMPTEGVWYCDELEISLSFDDNIMSSAIVDGQKIVCAVDNMRGSDVVSLSCQDRNTSSISLGEDVFVGEYVDLEDDRLVLREYGTENIYTFLRVQ